MLYWLNAIAIGIVCGVVSSLIVALFTWRK